MGKNVTIDYTETYISNEIKSLKERLIRQERDAETTKREILDYEKKLAYYRANKEDDA